MQNYLPACKIVSTHGVRGEMKALPLCDGAAFLAKFKRLFTSADGAGETRVLGVRAQGNVILLRLDGVTDMDAAPTTLPRPMPNCPEAAISLMTCWAVTLWMPTLTASTAS